MHRPRPNVGALFVALVAWLALFAVGCGDDSGASSGGGGDTLRLGYFPNVTHAPALVGLESGVFEEQLGDVELEPKPFNAGPEVVEAIFSGALDASYIGPNPAINAFTQSGGEAIRIVAGAASGGAFLVVKPDIDTPEDLRGGSVASPQLGNTQDVALRAWLAEQGLETDTTGGGDVSILPQENAQTLETFIAGDIDGAWVPEPWATRMIEEGDGKILVDERDLWPDGRYVTTHLLVRTEFFEDNPDVVKALLAGHVAAVDQIAADPAAAADLVVAGIEAATQKAIAPELVTASFESIEFTADPIASSLRESATDAKEVGLLESDALSGIYDLALLNELLVEQGKSEITE